MSKGVSGLYPDSPGTIEQDILNKRIIPGRDGVVTGGKSKILGMNIMKSLGLSNHSTWDGYQAQHIIPAEMKNHPVIQKMGMDLDHASNGIFLPIPTSGISTLSTHRGYHKVYSEFVRRQLDKININQSSVQLQKEVAALQKKLRKLQRTGVPLYRGYTSRDQKSKIYPNRQGNTVEMWERRFNAIK